MTKQDAAAAFILTQDIQGVYDDEKTIVQTFWNYRNIGLLEGLDESIIKRLFKNAKHYTERETFNALVKALKD